MAEFLNCYQNCGPANGGIRPCARQVFDNPRGVCTINITSDPAVQKLQPTAIVVTMDNLLDHRVVLAAKVDEKYGNAKTTVGFVEMGKVVPSDQT